MISPSVNWLWHNSSNLFKSHQFYTDLVVCVCGFCVSVFSSMQSEHVSVCRSTTRVGYRTLPSQGFSRYSWYSQPPPSFPPFQASGNQESVLHLHNFVISRKLYKDFPGGSVAKTPPSSAGGVGLIPGWGTKIPHPTGCSQTFFFLINK